MKEYGKIDLKAEKPTNNTIDMSNIDISEDEKEFLELINKTSPEITDYARYGDVIEYYDEDGCTIMSMEYDEETSQIIFEFAATDDGTQFAYEIKDKEAFADSFFENENFEEIDPDLDEDVKFEQVQN